MVFTVEQRIDNAFEKGELFVVEFEALDPTGADDYFAHIINAGKEPIDILRVDAESTVVGVLEVHKVTGTAAGGQTPQLPLNVKRGGAVAAVPNVIFATDPDITGLAKQASVGQLGIEAVLSNYTWKPERPVRVHTGEQAALLWTVATGILTGHLWFMKVPEPLD